MSHYMTDTEAAVYSAKTANLNMVGAGLVLSKTKCFACGKHKTTASGKTTKHGNFLCHSCKVWK
mgnify:CR=1 FL=1